MDNPSGTIDLAVSARLNTIRVINFYDGWHGNPVTTPYDPTQWQKVDQLIASAKRANLHVLLDLSDYRNILWNNCIDPYQQDWFSFLNWVAARHNTVDGEAYGTDATIALVSLAGEPEAPGTYTFTAPATGAACTISYGPSELTDFYARTLSHWKSISRVLVNTGGLGYLDFASGIDWQTIFSLTQNDVCAIKTYGGMLNFVPQAASYCAGLGKPWIDEEFGWQQSNGDAARSQSFANTAATLKQYGASAEMFWNLGYELVSGSYDIGPGTPDTFAAVQAAAS